MKHNPTLKFAPSGRWDAPSARPLAARWAATVARSKLRLLAMILIAVLALPFAVAQEQPSLASAAYAYLAAHGDNSRPQLRIFSVDLNRDGWLDGVVLLTGNNWCGSGGCSLLVFRGTEKGFGFVSASTVAQEPILVAPEIRHGWHTLIVSSGRSGKVLMQFDGNRYPSNPSLQPKPSRAQIEQALVLNRELVGQ